MKSTNSELAKLVHSNFCSILQLRQPPLPGQQHPDQPHQGAQDPQGLAHQGQEPHDPVALLQVSLAAPEDLPVVLDLGAHLDQGGRPGQLPQAVLPVVQEAPQVLLGHGCGDHDPQVLPEPLAVHPEGRLLCLGHPGAQDPQANRIQLRLLYHQQQPLHPQLIRTQPCSSLQYQVSLISNISHLYSIVLIEVIVS